MRFGYIVPNNWGIDDAGAVADVGARAEELGLHSVWVNHHVVNAGYIADRLGDKPYHDALTMLTWVAARTERVQLGTSVLVMPYLHPLVTAKAIATLDQLSNGRVIAGLGVGSLPEENEILGVPYDGRGAYSNEFIEVMRAVWTQPSASYSGEHFAFDGAVGAPRPRQQQVPIWIGGSGGPARRRAAAYGTGWHPMCSPEGLITRMPALIAELEANGRDRSSITIAPRVDVATLPDSDAVQQWRDAGADELIVGVSSLQLADHLEGLDHVAALSSRFPSEH